MRPGTESEYVKLGPQHKLSLSNEARNSEKSGSEPNHSKSVQICILRIIFSFPSREQELVSIFANFARIDLELQLDSVSNARHYKWTELRWGEGVGGLNIVHVNLACRTRRD